MRSVFAHDVPPTRYRTQCIRWPGATVWRSVPCGTLWAGGLTSMFVRGLEERAADAGPVAECRRGHTPEMLEKSLGGGGQHQLSNDGQTNFQKSSPALPRSTLLGIIIQQTGSGPGRLPNGGGGLRPPPLLPWDPHCLLILTRQMCCSFFGVICCP